MNIYIVMWDQGNGVGRGRALSARIPPPDLTSPRAFDTLVGPQQDAAATGALLIP